MPSVATLLVFSAAALGLLVVPGPAVLYITARSAAQGSRAGLVSVVGVHTGTLVHIAAAVAGLSAIVVSSAFAFSTVKLAGAGYLIWLGVRTVVRGRVGEGDAVPGIGAGAGRGRPDRGRFLEGGVLVGLGVAALFTPGRAPAGSASP